MPTPVYGCAIILRLTACWALRLNMSNCVFCGGGTSKEHILARWLIRDCKLDNENALIGFGASQKDTFETVTEEQSLSKFLLTSVCRRCNNGWMSALENTAKRALTPLLQTDWPEPDTTPLLALHPLAATWRYGSSKPP